MNKKSTKSSLTAAMIEEQTSAFLKAGGVIQHVAKGTSGQVFASASKLTSPK